MPAVISESLLSRISITSTVPEMVPFDCSERTNSREAVRESAVICEAVAVKEVLVIFLQEKFVSEFR